MGFLSRKLIPGVQVGLDKIYLAQLQLLSAIVAGYFLILSVIHVLTIEDLSILVPVVILSLLACISCVLIHLSVRFDKLPSRQSHYTFIPVAVFSTASTFLHIILSGDELQMMHAFIIMVVFSIVSLSPVIYASALGIAGSVFLLALYIIPGENDVHYIFMLTIMMILSSLGFVLKFRTIYKSVILVNSNRSKALSLEVASRQIKEKMAEIKRANVAKDQFIANVTHELRTPLTGTMGMLDLLKETELDDQQTFMVKTAQKSASSLLGVVNDMLVLGMIDAGKLELAQERTDLAALTRQVIEEYRSDAELKAISLASVEKIDDEVFVKGDAARLVHVLSKLVCNAVKFTEEGGVIVSLNWTRHKKGQTGKAVWRVADTGPGIPPDSITAMFDRFEQFDRTITRTSSGTGLGLAVVQEVVRAMGGWVEVKSDVDKGAVFTVSMNFDLWTDKPEMEADDTHCESPLELGENSTIKVLLAEDNYVNQVVVSRLLENLGAKVTVVENGQLAVDAVDQAKVPFDLICMDIQMPVMDGLSATRVIKMRSNKSPPIIAVTANTGDHDIREYKEAGIDAVVPKPVDFDHFRTIVFSVLGAQKKQRAADLLSEKSANNIDS